MRAKSPFQPQQPCTQKRRIKRSSFGIAECSFLCIFAMIAHVVFSQLFLAKKYRSWGEPCATPSGVSTRITGIAPYLSSGSPRTASISMRTKQLAASVCVCLCVWSYFPQHCNWEESDREGEFGVYKILRKA